MSARTMVSSTAAMTRAGRMTTSFLKEHDPVGPVLRLGRACHGATPDRLRPNAQRASIESRCHSVATRLAPTRWVTGLVDLEGGRLLDLVADRTRAAVDGWLGARTRDWLAQVGTVALDPWRGYGSALTAPLGHGHPQAAADRGRAAHPAGTSAAAGSPGSWGSDW